MTVEDLYKNDGIDYLSRRPDEILTEVQRAGRAGRAPTGSCGAAARSTSRSWASRLR